MESLSEYESVRLFLERAQAVQPSFAVTPANAPAVAQVCRRLDGIPLALELAGGAGAGHAGGDVNARLDDRFRLLTGGSRTALPRQQTLRALIDWSYDLLTEKEKTLLRRLSVFAGGWTLAAAEAVGAEEEGSPPAPNSGGARGPLTPNSGGTGVGEERAGGLLSDSDSPRIGGRGASPASLEPWEILDLLMGLVDKSLVVYEMQARDGEGHRYRFLETIRQYAGDRLSESGEAEAVQDRAAAWFLQVAEAADMGFRGPEQASWLSRLETEHDNLRAALDWYDRQASGGEALLRLTGALWRFWSVRGHFAEGRQWLDAALARTPDGTTEPDGPARPAALARSLTRAWALTGAGALAAVQGDFAAARALYEESLAIRRQRGNRPGIALSLNSLGNLSYNQGDFAAARALYEESLAIRRAVEDRPGIAMSLLNLGSIAHGQGDLATARALLEESLALQRQTGYQQGIANALNNLGNVVRCLGDFATARALLEEGLILWVGLENRECIAHSLEAMAGVAAGQSQTSRSVRLLAAASALRQTGGCPLATAETEEIDGWIASARAALGEAAFGIAWEAGQAMTWEQAVEYARDREYPPGPQ